MLYAQKTDSKRSFNRGFTVIELLIVIAVVAVMLSWAMPNLKGTLARNQLLGQANELASAMALARSEAVTRGTQAGVCASANGTTCSGSSNDWDKFILVFVDQDRGSDFDNTEPLLKSLGSHEKVDQFAPAASYFFTSSGFSTSNAVSSVQVCHENLAESDRCRTVTIAPTGIVTVRHSTKSAS